MSTTSKNNPCTPCRVECTGKASLTMNITRVFRSSDCTPKPCQYQWSADYSFGQTEIKNFKCDKPVDGCGKDEAGNAIAGLLSEALGNWLSDKLGGTTTDSSFKPDVGPGAVNAEVEFYVMIIVKKFDICFPKCEATVIPNGSPIIRPGPYQ